VRVGEICVTLRARVKYNWTFSTEPVLMLERGVVNAQEIESDIRAHIDWAY
jgi:hypothetical protein